MPIRDLRDSAIRAEAQQLPASVSHVLAQPYQVSPRDETSSHYHPQAPSRSGRTPRSGRRAGMTPRNHYAVSQEERNREREYEEMQQRRPGSEALDQAYGLPRHGRPPRKEASINLSWVQPPPPERRRQASYTPRESAASSQLSHYHQYSRSSSPPREHFEDKSGVRSHKALPDAPRESEASSSGHEEKPAAGRRSEVAQLALRGMGAPWGHQETAEELRHRHVFPGSGGIVREPPIRQKDDAKLKRVHGVMNDNVPAHQALYDGAADLNPLLGESKKEA